MSDSKQRFDEAFDEWAAAHPGIFSLYDMPDDQLRAIAGYFYFSGATDAIHEAQSTITQTAAALETLK